MRIALAQVDVSLGDVDANLERIGELAGEATELGADLVVLPELAANGYTLGQLPDLRCMQASDPRLAALSSQGPDLLLGFHEDGGARAHNSAAYLSGGGLVHLQRKLYLPTYLAWEERKFFSPGRSLRAFDTPHARAAVLICNDAWQAPLPWLAAHDGAELLLIPSNSAVGMSPAIDAIEYWGELLSVIARMHECWVVFVNRVGSENGFTFWGGSRIIDPAGAVVARAPLWEAAIVVAEVDIGAARRRRLSLPLLADARLGLVERELRRLIAEDTG